MVAAHHVETVAERCAIAGLERRPLLGSSVLREVAFHDHGRRLDRGHLDGGRAVHHLGVRLVARLAAPDRALGQIIDPPCLDLAEVHVVHGREPAEQFAVRPGERADRHAVEVVVGVGGETVVAPHLQAVVDDDEVVGDRRDVHQVLTTTELTTLSCQVCFLSSHSIQR